MTFSIKKDSTSPALRATLQYDDCSVVNLTNATVRFHMRRFGQTATVVDAAATVVSVGGVVEYQWAVGNTANIDSYEAEFEVTYADNTVEKFPSSGFISVEVTEAIA
jgi:hypothetical protein